MVGKKVLARPTIIKYIVSEQMNLASVMDVLCILVMW